jgi:hypothetical protein
MKARKNAAVAAARGTHALKLSKIAKTSFGKTCWLLAAACSLSFLAIPGPAEAGLYRTNAVPVQQFGFSTNGKVQTPQQYIQFFDVTARMFGAGGIVRPGLVWDPTRRSGPNFDDWNKEVLEPALATGIVLLPGIRTLNLDASGYRMPTDAQWTNGLRQIVRMYGPNGIYKTGGTYNNDGRTVSIAPHPNFKGLTDFELWNEPNAEGNLNGAMTPARITRLLRIGSAAMRDEAKKLGFKINIIGPAIGGINLDYLTQLWNADHNLFNYIDTLSIHAYLRFPPSDCDTFGPGKVRCVKSFADIRSFMDRYGGAHVHLGVTEAGTAGDRGSCLGPQVRTEEQQRDYSIANLEWLRARPGLKFDFWITINPIDGTRKYGYPCDSGIYDIPYWESKLGVFRADMSMKPLGIRWRDLTKIWRSAN